MIPAADVHRLMPVVPVVGEIVVMIEVAVVRSAARGIVARVWMVGVVVGTMIVVTAHYVIGMVVIVHAMVIHGTVVFRMNDLRATVHARLAHLGTEVAHAATKVAAAAEVAHAPAEIAAAAKASTEVATATETAAASERISGQTESAD